MAMSLDETPGPKSDVAWSARRTRARCAVARTAGKRCTGRDNRKSGICIDVRDESTVTTVRSVTQPGRVADISTLRARRANEME
jgi:hypothetical protein